MKEVGYVLFGVYVMLTAWLLLNGLIQLHLWWKTKQKTRQAPPPWKGPLPFITIQVPLYNEKYVVEGLLDTLSKLHYPRQLFEIMVLDDSTDETSGLVYRKAEVLRKNGFDITIIRRPNRRGYKAGALQESLHHCKGELIALFDADFRPAPDFLISLLPHFTNPETGLVQARWIHQNREQNFLTRIQAYLLDTHFMVEQEGRQAGGYYINFCGTAGIWRKACIEDAGGWDGDVLSEDLDLSYRAQLMGWKIFFDAATKVPSELPPDMEAFKIQQARWTKGIMQVFRKNVQQVIKQNVPLAHKIHACFHLTSSFVFPCLFFNSLLSLPLLILRNIYPEFVVLTNAAAVGGLNLVMLSVLFYQGVKAGGDTRQFTRYYPLFLVVYMALAVQNTLAVLQGMFGKPSAFVRTPKYASGSHIDPSYRVKKTTVNQVLEIGSLLYFLFGIYLSFYLEDPFFLLLFGMMSCGLLIVILQSLSWSKLRSVLLPKLRLRRLLFLFKYE